MPLFGLIKKNKKKTKDQQTPDDNDDKEASRQSSSTTTGGGPAAAAGASVSKSTSNHSSSSNKKQLSKIKSDQSAASSNLTPVRTISHKTPNPFTAQPVNIPKKPGLSPPADLDKNRMYSSSPFSTSPQPPLVSNQQQPYQHQPQQQQQQQQQQPHLQNVVTGQYNAPPTPPSTARSGSIDDKIDSLSPAITNTTTQPYQHDQLKHPQPQQGYQQYNNDVPSADAMIASSSGLLTPVPNANDRVIPSYLPSVQAASTARTTKGKYSIVDFSIQRTLGTGSFGRVHLVQSRHNSRFYAIKVPSFRLH
jgi:hypothetical protein